MIFERKKYLDELIAGRGISAPRLNTTSQTSPDFVTQKTCIL